jgi:hypothetical protein
MRALRATSPPLSTSTDVEADVLPTGKAEIVERYRKPRVESWRWRATA